MWLFKSSIGRKLVMAVTGVCLVLFVTFHALMNAVALIWPASYNDVCEFLGANWYALIASAGLAVLFIVHIWYASWLTIQNRAARGNDPYAVQARPKQVEWSSKNMYILGLVILAFLVVHLINFWSKMQWQELRHAELLVLPQLEGIPVAPAQGTLFLQMAFSQVYVPIVYIIGFVALWFHMNHGFWSMLHTAGWDNNLWLPRLKRIACWWTTIVVGLFIAEAIVFTVHAHSDYYVENEELQEQYAQFWNEQAADNMTAFNEGMYAKIADLVEAQKTADYAAQQAIAQEYQARIEAYVDAEGPAFVDRANAIDQAFQKFCSKIMPGQEMQQMQQFAQQVKQKLDMKQMVIQQSAQQAAQQAQTQTQPQPANQQ